MHKSYIPQWARERALKFDAIDPLRTAVLVVDMQNFFVAEDGFLGMSTARSIVPNINAITRKFRSAGSLIIYIRHTGSEEAPYALPDWQKESSYADGSGKFMLELLAEGQSQHNLYPALDVMTEDLLVNKHRYSALIHNSSNLHSILQGRSIDTVIVTGTATNVCCESTARDAAMLDYKVFFIDDATATQNDEVHNAALLNLCHVFADIRSAREMMDMLGDNRPFLVQQDALNECGAERGR